VTTLWPTLTVRDVDASLAFYSGTLGFRRDLRECDEGGIPTLGSVEVGDTVIMLETPAPGADLALNHGALSGVTLTVCLPSSADIDSLYGRLQREGAAICSPIADRPWGNRDFGIRDPDGYQLIVAQQIRGAHDHDA
jgi:uncharacterized glyoxalase superfamily protein PhnB